MPAVTRLIVAAQRGDALAFAALVERFQDMVWAMARARTRSAEQAHEVTQEVFLASWQGLPTLRHPEAFVRVLRWLCVKHADRAVRRTTEDLPSTLPEASVLPSDPVVARQERERLVAAVQALPETLRDAVALTYWADLSAPEVAAALDVSPGAVRKRLTTARKRLKETLMIDNLDTERPSADARRALLIRLLLAARTGNEAEATRVLAADARLLSEPPSLDLDDKEQYVVAGGRAGFTPLHFAAADGHLGVVHVLLQAGADPDAATRGGRTALHEAVLAGSADVVDALLHAGASPNAAYRNGLTSLHLAAMRGQASIIRALLAAGGDPGVQGPEGWTPADWASERHHLGSVALLSGSDALWTGIKAIDLLAPMARGGVTHAVGSTFGLGIMVLAAELLLRFRDIEPIFIGSREWVADASDLRAQLQELGMGDTVVHLPVDHTAEAWRSEVRELLDRPPTLVISDRAAIADIDTGTHTVLVIDYGEEEAAPVDHADAVWVFSRDLATRGHYPAISVSQSRSRLAGPLAESVRAAVAAGDRHLEAYLTQPFLCAETHTGWPGRVVTGAALEADTRDLLDGKLADVDPASLRYRGRLHEGGVARSF